MRSDMNENSKEEKSILWPTYLMSIAQAASFKSKDNTQVGAALVGQHNSVILTAYNGPPRGVKDLPERFERPLKYLYAQHAERNLIDFAARNGIRTDGCTVYVTHLPCCRCAGSLIQAGISTIVYGSGTTSMPAEEFEVAKTMLREADVRLFSLDAMLDVCRRAR
jgi:dCMP deaminase